MSEYNCNQDLVSSKSENQIGFSIRTRKPFSGKDTEKVFDKEDKLTQNMRLEKWSPYNGYES